MTDHEAPIVLPHGQHKGLSLAEVYQVDPAFMRELAWGARQDSALDNFLRGQAAEFLSRQGEAPPAPAPPDTAPAGERLFVQLTEDTTVYVDVGDDVRFLLATEETAIGHHLPFMDARVLAADLSLGRLSDRFYDYGGFAGPPALFTSLAVSDKGDSFRYPIRLEVRQGAGDPASDGMRPEGALQTLATQISRYEARGLGLALSEYLLALALHRLIAS